MRSGTILIAAAALCCGGCSSAKNTTTTGGSSATASFSGNAGFDAVDGIANESLQITGGAYDSILFVSFSDHANVCAALQNNVSFADSHEIDLEIDLSGTNKSGGAIKSGSYDITVGTAQPDENGIATTVQAHLYALDDNCSGPTDNAASGTITISSHTATTISGSFNLDFMAGTISGNFSAPICTFNTIKGSVDVSKGTRTCQLQ